MQNRTEELLARSLTAESTELIPFLPYLLQDFWELGSDPKEMAGLLEKHMPLSPQARILDLACGKGAVSVKAAERLKVNVHGFDLIPEFIEYARQKAAERGVAAQCRFELGDANEVVNTQKNYDCVIFGAAGNILGTPKEMLEKLTKTIKPGGYILIDDCYLPDDTSNDAMQYQNYEYLTHDEWQRLFKASGLIVLEESEHTGASGYNSDYQAIVRRTKELAERHPEKRALFEGYARSQLNEYEDIENSLAAVTWMLKRDR